MLLVLAMAGAPARAEPPAPSVCFQYEHSLPDARTSELFDAAYKEAALGSNARCQGILAIGYLSRHECESARVLAKQAVANAPAEPLAAFSKALADECVYSANLAFEARGRPVRCDTDTVTRIVEGLIQGVVLSDFPEAWGIAIEAAHHLATFCRDDEAILLGFVDVASHESRITSRAVSLWHQHPDTAMNLTGGILLDRILSSEGDLPQLGRIQARFLLEEGLKMAANCLSKPGSACRFAGTKMVEQCVRLAVQTPGAMGLLLDDLLLVGRHGGFAVPTIANAMVDLPLEAAGSRRSQEVRQAVHDLREYLRPHAGEIRAAFTDVKLAMFEVLDDSDSCRRAVKAHGAIAQFASPSIQMPVKLWANLLKDAAMVCRREASDCANAAPILAYCDHVFQELDATPPRSPFPEIIQFDGPAGPSASELGGGKAR